TSWSSSTTAGVPGEGLEAGAGGAVDGGLSDCPVGGWGSADGGLSDCPVGGCACGVWAILRAFAHRVACSAPAEASPKVLTAPNRPTATVTMIAIRIARPHADYPVTINADLSCQVPCPFNCRENRANQFGSLGESPARLPANAATGGRFGTRG